MSPFLQASLLIAAAYLLGSVSGSLVLGRFRGVDIRTLGSGSAGGTNAFRTQGTAFALAVVAIDMGKGVLAAALARALAPGPAPFDPVTLAHAAVLAAALGHVWPVWHGFRGGKGAATLAGGLLVAWPWVVPVLFVAWLATLLSTGYVGLATVLAALSLLPMAALTDAPAVRWWFAALCVLLILVTHRHNLRRLLDGSENRFERARLLRRLRGGGGR